MRRLAYGSHSIAMFAGRPFASLRLFFFIAPHADDSSDLCCPQISMNEWARVEIRGQRRPLRFSRIIPPSPLEHYLK